MIPEMSGTDCIVLVIKTLDNYKVPYGMNFRYLAKKTISDNKSATCGTCDSIIFHFDGDLRRVGVNLSPRLACREHVNKWRDI
jgi:hypothetical protein